MKCQNELNEGANFCFNCGSKVEKEQNCQQCHTKIMAGAKFCFNCGEPVVQSVETENEIDFTIFDELIKEENAINWYRKYYEYIGEFVDGFAPVIDNIENPQYVGFVSMNISEKLISKDPEKSSANPPNYILFHYDINNKLKELYGDERIVWAGEFHEGKALIANKKDIYTIDLTGNIQVGGYIRKDITHEFRPEKCFVAINKGLYRNSFENENDCILDYKGNLVRNRYEFIKSLYFDDFATFVNIDNGKLGMLRISNGEQLLDAKYDDLYCEDLINLEGKKQSVIISRKKKANGEFYGCLNPYKGWIFKTKYPSIEIIRDDYNGGLSEGQLLVCLSTQENEEYNTIYNMAVSDIDGKFLFEYTSDDSRYAVIDGKTCVFISNDMGVDVVVIDHTVVLSCPNATSVSCLGEGYFKVHNKVGQVGIVNRSGNFTIPYGQFDKIDSRRIYDGAIKVSKNKLWGFVDLNGSTLIPLMYKNIRDEYSLAECPEITVYPIEGEWFLINYKNETFGEVPAEEYIRINYK